MIMITPTTQRGLGLIEALLSLLVLSVGTVAAVRMQSAILDAHCTAKSSALAATLIDSIASEVRQSTGSCNAVTQTADGVTVAFEPINNPGVTTYCRYNITITHNQCRTSQTTSYSDVWIMRANTATVSGSGGSGLEVPQPTAAERINEAAVTSPVGTVQNNTIDAAVGVRITRDESDKFRLYVATPNNQWKEAVRSNVPFVRISGVVASSNSTIAALRASGSQLTLNTSYVGHCLFPLSYTNPNDVTTYTAAAPANNAKAAAYICYVPEGWEGTIGIDFLDWPNKTHACPDLSPNNPAGLRGGYRTHKTIFSSILPPTSESHILGQSGVRSIDEPLLRNLHFLIYEDNQQQRCNLEILNKNNQGVPQYITISDAATPPISLHSMGYGGLQQLQNLFGTGTAEGLEGLTCRNKDTCLKPADYWIRVGESGLISGVLARKVGSNAFNWNNVTLSVVWDGVPRSCALEPVVSDTRRFICLIALDRGTTLTVFSSGGPVSIDSATPAPPYNASATGITVTIRDGS